MFAGVVADGHEVDLDIGDGVLLLVFGDGNGLAAVVLLEGCMRGGVQSQTKKV